MSAPIVGHGLDLDALEILCDRGAFKPLNDFVLLEAIWPQLADPAQAAFVLDNDGRSTLLIGDAMAFRVRGLGPQVVESDGLRVGSLVLNCSIAGEKVTGNRKGGRFLCVRAMDLCGGADADAVAALVAERIEKK